MKPDASDTTKAILTFATGIAAGIALVKTAKSKLARKAAVSVVAKGLQLKDEAQATYASIKEDAQDVVAEARNKNEECLQAEPSAPAKPETGAGEPG